MTMRAELRKRDDGMHGVFWVVDEAGNPVGDQQMEIYFGPDCLGSRLAFSLYVQELAKQPGWSLAEEVNR